MQTIAEAKQYLKDNYVEGVRCPCCDQLVKKYSRKITSTMARSLISLYHESTSTYSPIHITNIKFVQGGEFAQMRRWGLIAEAKNETTTKRTSGLWYITQKGKDFVNGRIQVPMYCDTYNGKTLGFSRETTTIKQALGNKFDYMELMGRPTIPDQEAKKAISWL